MYLHNLPEFNGQVGVSFIVPIYNKAPYLTAVLHSIRNQRGNFNCEYVFVDDGSTDGSTEILREVTRDWPDTTLIFQSNHGPAHANNRALEQARMPYVKFVDADDVLIENATQTLLDALHGSEAAVAWGTSRCYDDAANLDTAPVPAGARTLFPADQILKSFITTAPFNPSQTLVRRDCIELVDGSDERTCYTQDYTLFLRLAARWPFLRVESNVVAIQDTDPGRVSANKPELQRQVTLALSMFIDDHPNILAPLVRFACRRAAKRALLHARRNLSGRVIRERYMAVLASYSPFGVANPAAFIENCTRVFEPEATQQQYRIERLAAE